MAVVFGECGRECLSGPGNTENNENLSNLKAHNWAPLRAKIFPAKSKD
jgi:hypothetical protein